MSHLRADEEYLCSLGVNCAALWPYDPRSGPGANNPCRDVAPTLQPPTEVLSVTNGYMWVHHSTADSIERMDGEKGGRKGGRVTPPPRWRST